MMIIKSLNKFVKTAAGAVLVMGNFDGLHMGHQVLLKGAVREGRKRKRRVFCLTFTNHPAEVLRELPPQRLMTTEERTAGLERAGLDGVILLRFTPALAGVSAEDFLDLLCRKIRPGVICVGENFFFGAGGKGRTDFLKSAAESRGYILKVFPVLRDGGKPVSSSRIRDLIGQGRVTEASLLLGRPYGITGRVIRGEGRGRELGFPTINFDPGRIGKILPAKGVYRTATAVPGRRKVLPSVTFIGTRFRTGAPALETHIPGFHGNLYGRSVTVSFLRFLRKPKRFRTAGALIHSIQKDMNNIKEA